MSPSKFRIGYFTSQEFPLELLFKKNILLIHTDESLFTIYPSILKGQ